MIKKTPLLFLLIGWFFSVSLHATLINNETHILENKTNQATQQKWLALHRENPYNSNLLYNIGKSYEQQNKRGLARAYYLKALALNPQDKSSQINLKILEKDLIDQELLNQNFFESLLKAITFKRPHNELGWLFLVLLAITSTLIWLPFKIIRTSRYFLFTLTCLSGLLFCCAHVQSFSIAKSIITTPKTAVYSGPSESLPTFFYIHEGTRVYPLKSNKNWQKITLKNGLEGWIKNSDIFTL